MRPIFPISLLLLALVWATPPHAESGISIGGDARMGVVWESAPSLGPAESGLRMTARTRLRLQFEGQTDSGLSYGAELRLDKETGRRQGGALRLGAPDPRRDTTKD